MLKIVKYEDKHIYGRCERCKLNLVKIVEETSDNFVTIEKIKCEGCGDSSDIYLLVCKDESKSKELLNKFLELKGVW